MKKSIVLLITLALIIALSTFIAIGLFRSDQASQTVQKKNSIIQISTLLHNITDILSQKSGEINSTEGLEMLILLPIELQTKSLSLHISFDSAAKGINPNNILFQEHNKSRLNPDYILLFDRILQSVQIQNKELFLALLEDTLDKDLEERIPGSEIALYNKRFVQGKIENFQKFQMLIDQYVKLTEDNAIYQIPWKEILSFYHKKIDFNYISPKLLRYMVPYMDEETIQNITLKKKMSFSAWKDIRIAQEYKKELQKFQIAFYVPVIRAKVTFKENTKKYNATFIYDIKQKKVLDIGYKVD